MTKVKKESTTNQSVVHPYAANAPAGKALGGSAPASGARNAPLTRQARERQMAKNPTCVTSPPAPLHSQNSSVRKGKGKAEGTLPPPTPSPPVHLPLPSQNARFQKGKERAEKLLSSPPSPPLLPPLPSSSPLHPRSCGNTKPTQISPPRLPKRFLGAPPVCSTELARFFSCLVCLGTATSSTRLCMSHSLWLDDKQEAQRKLEKQFEEQDAAWFASIPDEAFARADLWVY